MEITVRDLLTIIHGMGFGALFMLAFSGAIGEIYWFSAPGVRPQPETREHKLLGFYLSAMVVLAWAAVITGAYVIYPWYRAIPPHGVADLAAYPQAFLTSSPLTSEWHNLGMEWKENVAWLAPISMTMVAYVTMKYGVAITKHRQLRLAILSFAVVAFIATGIAGAFGAFLNKFAPVRGGTPIVLLHGK